MRRGRRRRTGHGTWRHRRSFRGFQVPGPDKRSGQGRAAQLRLLPDQCARPPGKRRRPRLGPKLDAGIEGKRCDRMLTSRLVARRRPAGESLRRACLLEGGWGIEVAGSIGEGDPCVRAGKGIGKEKGRGRPVCLAVPRGQQRGWDGGGVFFFVVVVLRDDAYAKINQLIK